MLNVIYTLKACLLIMYHRLTVGTTESKLVKLLGAYVAIGWASTQIAFFTACRPFYGYWAVPPPDPQCTTLQHYAIVQACFNLSSDVMMLFIALPMVYKLKLPLKQKIVLGVVFSMGIFVVSLAASTAKIEQLTDRKTDHCGHSHQSIQPIGCLRYSLYALVYPRILRCNLCRKSSHDLATPS
jgi:hypothetical protein